MIPLINAKKIAAAVVCVGCVFGYAGVAREKISNEYRVLDGSTLGRDGQKVAIWGVQAPPLTAHCSGVGLPWPCGVAARDALKDFVSGYHMACEQKPDRENGAETVACASDPQGDLGAWLVANGWAVDNMDESGGAHLEAQWSAQRRGIGVWANR